MRKVTLNHAASHPNRIRLSHAILVAGLVAAMLVTLAWSQVDARQAALEAALDRLRNPGTRSAPDPAARSAQNTEIAAARAAMAELSIAWEPLLQGLEGIRMGDVRLLAIEPSPRQRKLRITAETGAAGRILDYVQALGRLPMLKDVALQRQEKGDDGRQVFSVEAVWDVQHEN